MEDATHDLEMSLTDRLALDRTQLANERTLLAYGRTAMMVIASGGTVLKFFGDSNAMAISGWGLLALGGVLAAFGLWRFSAMRKALRSETRGRR